MAYENNYIIKTSVSNHGFGFFEIAVRTPNSNAYTPDEAEVVFFIEDENQQLFNQQYYQEDYHNYSVPEAVQVRSITDNGSGVYPEANNAIYAAEVVNINEDQEEEITHVEVLDQDNVNLPSY